MMKKKDKLNKKQLNLTAIQINSMKHVLGPLWRNYYDQEHKKKTV